MLERKEKEGEMMDNTCNDLRPRRTATCDEECWVRDRILTAIKAGIALRGKMNVRADEPIERYGLMGLAEGCAVEVLHSLGMGLEHINIKKLRSDGEIEAARKMCVPTSGGVRSESGQ